MTYTGHKKILQFFTQVVLAGTFLLGLKFKIIYNFKEDNKAIFYRPKEFKFLIKLFMALVHSKPDSLTSQSTITH